MLEEIFVMKYIQIKTLFIYSETKESKTKIKRLIFNNIKSNFSIFYLEVRAKSLSSKFVFKIHSLKYKTNPIRKKF